MMAKRGEFIKNCGSIEPHNERFNMDDKFDMSTYLTKVRRIKGREFHSYSNRDSENLIKQGGNPINTDVVGNGKRTEQYYDTECKERKLMERLDKKCLPFDAYEKRNKVGSIYREDYDKRKDPYDLEKVFKGKIATTKNSGKSNLVALDKQEKRDITKMYRGTVGDAYANIQRENEKADYIKKLLMQAE